MNILVDTNIYLTSMHYAGIKRKVMWLIIEAGDTLVITDTILEELININKGQQGQDF